MSRLTYEQRQAFLLTVRAMCKEHPELLAEIVAAGTQGMQDKVHQFNELRCEAEVALSMVFDLVPKTKQNQNLYAFVRAQKVLVHSGMFAGTEMAKRMEASITRGDAELAEREKQRDESMRLDRIEHDSKLNLRRAQEAQKRNDRAKEIRDSIGAE